MKFTRNLHWLIYSLFLLSCARQSSPTGGPKDTIPPVLVRAIPPNEAINFKAKEIELIFSEDVILNTPKEQLIVTPTISKEYKIVYRKNSVILTLDEPLQDSTTYTFNFRETVQDITEKNPVENLQLAYSTGTYIDSLSIEGRVFNQLRGTGVKDVTVALHVENDTFNIFEHPAVYFTKTDDDGNFKISHLKPDNYFIYAFQDKNRNLVVNSRSEAYGFLREYQYLLDNIGEVSIGLINLDAGPLKLTSARPYNTYFNIRTSKNMRTFNLSAVDSSDIVYTFGEDNANIRLYDTTEKDSLQVRLQALDSIGNAIDTTLYAKFLTREVTPEEFKLSLEKSSLTGHKGDLEAVIHFTKPVKEINFDSIYYRVDSLTHVKISSQDLTWEPLERKMKIKTKLDKAYFTRPEANGQPMGRRGVPASIQAPDTVKKQTPLYELYLGKGAFISIEDDSSQRATQHVKPVYSDDLSIINIEIQTDEENFLVELLDNNFKVIRQLKNQRKVRFEDVIPGDYKIRLIIDENGNGMWDPGNYFKNTEPEKAIYYEGADGSTTIKGVKANWDIGEGEMFITY
jgi:uncharacterized protein (DUF2141 family)